MAPKLPQPTHAASEFFRKLSYLLSTKGTQNSRTANLFGVCRSLSGYGRVRGFVNKTSPPLFLNLRSALFPRVSRCGLSEPALSARGIFVYYFSLRSYLKWPPEIVATVHLMQLGRRQTPAAAEDAQSRRIANYLSAEIFFTTTCVSPAPAIARCNFQPVTIPSPKPSRSIWARWEHSGNR